jgi:tetratricopeptide (TPR) repeat protein
MKMAGFGVEVLELARRGDYDAALDVMAASGQNVCATDLVLMGRCILLSNGGPGREIPDAQNAFERALEHEPEHGEALTELGWLHYGVNDDAATAKPYFERALDVARDLFTEALQGVAKCVGELHGEEARTEFVRGAASFLRDRIERYATRE